MIGRNDLADRRVRESRSLPEQTGDESELEHPEPERRTRFAREPADDVFAAALEQVGRLEEDPLTLCGRASATTPETPRPPRRSPLRLVGATRRDARDDVSR